MWSNDRFSIIRTTMWSTFETRLRSAASSGTVVTPGTDRPYPVGTVATTARRQDWRKATLRCSGMPLSHGLFCGLSARPGTVR